MAPSGSTGDWADYESGMLVDALQQSSVTDFGREPPCLRMKGRANRRVETTSFIRMHLGT